MNGVITMFRLGSYNMNQDPSQNYQGYNYAYQSQPAPETSGFDGSQMYGSWGGQPAYGASYTQPASYSGGAKPKPTGLYKTQLCRHYEQKGFCNLGEKCNFAHGKEELRESAGGSAPAPVASSYNYGYQQKPYQPPSFSQVDPSTSKYYKTVLCRNFQQTGQCSFGPNCKFAHGDDELRSHPMGGMQPGDAYSAYSAPAMQYPAYANQMPAFPGYYQTPYDNSGYGGDASMDGFSTQSVAGAEIGDTTQNYSYNYTPEGGMYSGYEATPDTTQAYTGAPGGSNDASNQYYGQNLSGSGFKSQEGFQQ